MSMKAEDLLLAMEEAAAKHASGENFFNIHGFVEDVRRIFDQHESMRVERVNAMCRDAADEIASPTTDVYIPTVGSIPPLPGDDEGTDIATSSGLIHMETGRDQQTGSVVRHFMAPRDGLFHFKHLALTIRLRADQMVELNSNYPLRCPDCGATDDDHHSYTCPTNLHPDRKEDFAVVGHKGETVASVGPTMVDPLHPWTGKKIGKTEGELEVDCDG